MAVPSLYRGLERIGNDYGAAFVATYREAKRKASDKSDIPFSKVRLVYHGGQLVRHGISKRKLVVKNFPDALYTFRARPTSQPRSSRTASSPSWAGAKATTLS